MKKPFLSALFFLISTFPLAAQPAFDNSGNGLLNGTYYFRHVFYEVSTKTDPSTGIAGEIGGAIAIYGNISFDGNGNYSISASAQVDDSSVGGTTALSCYLASKICTTGTAVAGTYAVSASGYGYITNPLASGDLIYGMVSSQSHIFVASSTETQYTYNDIFIAAPVSSPPPSNSTFQGSYTVYGYLPGGDPRNSADVFFPLTADGAGNLGTVNVSGYFGGSGTQAYSQSNASMKYTFSGGAAVVNWPASTTAYFFAGPEYFYFSPDGNFFFGGAPLGGYDMIVGIRNGTGTQNFQGLYYEGGLDQDLSALTSSGFANFDTYFGSFKAATTGNIVVQDRLNSLFNTSAIGSSYYDSFTPPVTGTYTDSASSFQYTVGSNGTMRIGVGIAPYFGITVAFLQPPFTPTGSVYIDPTGVVNAASFAPFTAGIVGGEYLAIYGTNLAGGTTIASAFPFPTALGNVQVLINGVAAPIYYVTPGQISVISPASIPGPLAQIQVINNGVPSNTVTVPLNVTAPGVFTIENNGIGHAAALHGNLTPVTENSPAAPGETIAVYLNGLGAVFPTVPDGAQAPNSPLSTTTNTITAAIGGTTASVSFAGLAPGYAALYQVNVTVPSGLTAGDYTLGIGGPDSYSAEAIISVGGAASSARPAVPAVKMRSHLTGKSRR
jgi:uncharacterized protein (TIGR03437 family)